MKLDTIRKKLGYVPGAKQTVKDEARLWLGNISPEYPIALTLTVKEQPVQTTLRKQNYLDKANCERTARLFVKKLNRQLFGKRAADKYGKSIKCIAVIEGERSHKRLHLHFAIGGIPPHIRFNQIDRLVCAAKQQVPSLDVKHKVDIADRGWMEYISKEFGENDIDNLILSIA